MSGNGRSTSENSRDMANDKEVEVRSTISKDLQSSVGTSKYKLRRGKKKSKKWSPFDLGRSESEYKVEIVDGAIPKRGHSVPKLTKSVQGTSLAENSFVDSSLAGEFLSEDSLGDRPLAEHSIKETSLRDSSLAESSFAETTLTKTNLAETTLARATENKQGSETQEFPSTESIIYRDRSDSFHNSLDTTAGTTLNTTFSHLQSTSAKIGHERSIIHQEDTNDTKVRLELIMARIDNVFDAEEWDPDLPPASSNNSPEQLTMEPQRVTYTTVGSVAKTDAVPVFTPPIRAQREGAGRRLSIHPAPVRVSDNYYSRTQQPGASSSTYGPLTSNQKNVKYSPQQQVPLPPLDMAELEKFNMTDLEKETLFQSINSVAANVLPSNTPTKQHDQQPPLVPETSFSRSGTTSLNSATDGNFSIQKMLQEEVSGPGANLTGSSAFAGLNKMQTLQRLAQFDNPAQKFAKDRLAEFKAVKMQQQMSNMTMGESSSTQARSYEHTKSGMHQFGSTASDISKDNYHGHGIQYPGQENKNPLHASHDPTQDYQMRAYGSRGQPGHLSYPQPLKAGPPRQGQNSIAVNRISWNSGNSQTMNNQQQFHCPPTDKHQSPWNDASRHSQATDTQQQLQVPPADKQQSSWNDTSGHSQATNQQQYPWNSNPGHIQATSQQQSPWNSTSGHIQAANNQQQSPWNNTSGNSHATNNQRQSPWNNNSGNTNNQQQSPWNTTSGNSQATNNQQQSPWNDTFRGQSFNTFSSVVTKDNYIRDTLSIAEMAKYYPNGFGPNFHYNGQHIPSDNYANQSNLGLEDQSLKAKQQRKAEKAEKADDWFYSGLSRVDMTMADHIEELEIKDKGLALPKIRPNIEDREVLSVKQVQDMTESECVSTLVNNLFGTLMAYSDNNLQPNNRRVLSNFVPSPAWQLDTSEEGKRSFFGADLVVALKKSARDLQDDHSSPNEQRRADDHPRN